MSSAFADQPILVAAPADPHIERTCCYARSADMRSLITETERKMVPPSEAELFVGVDLGAVASTTMASLLQFGTTTGRIQSRGPNIGQIPRGDYTRHRSKTVDYLNLLGPIQSGAADTVASAAFHEKMKELLKDVPPLKFATLPMDQECMGIRPGEFFIGMRPGGTCLAAMHFHSKEQKLIDETESKMLGFDIALLSEYEAIEGYTPEPFKTEVMGIFPEPVVDEETGHVHGSWGPNNGELDGPSTGGNRIRRKEEDGSHEPT